MDKKSKVLLWVMGILIAVSVGATYWRIMIKKDYVIEAQADCDPTLENCFVYHCDAEAGEECTGDEEQDTSYFKKVQRVAANIPLCDPADENCKPWDCIEGEKDCSATFCDQTLKTEDEECSDPETYNAEHPLEAEDEEAICEEGDDECAAAESETSGDDQSEDGEGSAADTQESE